MMETIAQFYEAFARHDAQAMTALYHDSVHFEDPVFGPLEGERAKAMWRMLVERGGDDLKVVFRNVKGTDSSGSADWDAEYTFKLTGRHVHNRIHAEFELKDNKIIRHKDHFSLHRWATQALGFRGWLLGGTGFFKRKLRANVLKSLDQYMVANPQSHGR